MDGGTVSASPIAGMKLVWNDEFDVPALDTNKWFTQYYSTADFLEKTNWEEFQTGTLPNLLSDLRETRLYCIPTIKILQRLTGNREAGKFHPSRRMTGGRIKTYWAIKSADT